MAIGTQMPQDILKYEAKFVANLSTRECIFYGTGVVIGLAIFFTFGTSLPLKMRIIACACGCLPFFIWGSAKPYGQPLEKIIIPFIIDNVLSPPLRIKEVHYPEFEASRRTHSKEKGATPSKEYPEIR